MLNTSYRPTLERIGATMARLRTAASMTQEHAGKSAGLSASTVSRIERGEGLLPLDQIGRICAVYGHDLADVLVLATRPDGDGATCTQCGDKPSCVELGSVRFCDACSKLASLEMALDHAESAAQRLAKVLADQVDLKAQPPAVVAVVHWALRAAP